MCNCYWEEIHSFRSPNEYRNFVQWIEAQVRGGECEEISEKGNISNPSNDRRFRCVASNEIWKLSCPDPAYFCGSWLPEISLNSKE